MFVLLVGLMLEGVVREDATGRAIPEATVALRVQSPGRVTEFKVKTDGGGRFSADTGEEASVVWVSARASGFRFVGPVAGVRFSLPQREPVEIRLARAAEIRGRAEGLVELFDGAWNRVARASGAFVFGELAPGEYWVQAGWSRVGPLRVKDWMDVGTLAHPALRRVRMEVDCAAGAELEVALVERPGDVVHEEQRVGCGPVELQYAQATGLMLEVNVRRGGEWVGFARAALKRQSALRLRLEKPRRYQGLSAERVLLQPVGKRLGPEEIPSAPDAEGRWTAWLVPGVEYRNMKTSSHAIIRVNP